MSIFTKRFHTSERLTEVFGNMCAGLLASEPAQDEFINYLVLLAYFETEVENPPQNIIER